MADFLTAHRLTMGDEGGFANNPADPGGPTYKGVASEYWGELPLWTTINRHLAKMPSQPVYGTGAYRIWVKELNRRLAADQDLQKAICSFYKSLFWDKNHLGEINDQPIANWLYDHIVNGGGRGAKWMQQAAGVTPDGAIGPKSVAAINADNASFLLEAAEDIAASYRLKRAHDDPSQIQFLHSWLSRDGLSEEEIAHVLKAAADGVLTDAEVAQLEAEIRSS